MTSKKARYRAALRYGKRIERIPGIIFPPSVTIAYAHRIDSRFFPLMARRQWKAMTMGRAVSTQQP